MLNLRLRDSPESNQGTHMHGDKPGLIHLFRPEVAKTAAAAVKWLRPPHAAPIFKPKRIFPAAPVLGRIGPLEVRLAQSKSDVKRAQKLRYKVFYKDGNAIADAATMLAQRDKLRLVGGAFQQHAGLAILAVEGEAGEVMGAHKGRSLAIVHVKQIDLAV